MNYGIFRHGFFKTFLTRGFLRSIFKPLIYTKSENIHGDFVEVVNDFVLKIEREIKPKNAMAVMFWLTIVPKLFFEMIFVENERGEVYLDVLNNATENKGRECAFITQAFILWNLQQILQNKKEYRDEMGFSIEDLEEITKIILGQENKIIHYLNYYREKFDLKKLEVDPRDWSIIYVWDICDTLITDKKVLKETMQEWNDDMLKKMEFISFTTHFIIEQKETASKLSKKS